jgi:tRNA A37 threonylcarbamoyladenosine modification protein TsaB
VRIAVSYAKGLALAARVPLAGVSSYDTLTPGGAPDPVLTVVYGRPGVISARLRTSTGVRTSAGPVDRVLAALLGDFGSGELTVAGNTEEVLVAIAARGIAVKWLEPAGEIPARAVARLAGSAGPAPSLHAVAPDYGELPAVTVRGRA